MDESGSTQIKPTQPQTLTQGAYNNRYGHILKAQAYANLSDKEKAEHQLYNQFQAYQRALDARKNAQFMSSDKGKATALARNLRKQLKESYKNVYGSDAGFGKWLTSGAQTGLMGFANSAYQTAGMVEDSITNAANKAYWTLNNGNNPDRWMKSYFGNNPNEDDPMYKVYTAYKNAQAARKGAGAFSGVSGDTWMSAEEQLRDRLEQMYRERINDDYLFDPEGGALHQLAERSNELYNWTQEQNQKQLEFQKMGSTGKGWDIANQLVIGTAQALPYAAFGMLGAAGAGGEIGAQLSPQTTGILNKVADTLQSFAKSPDYWLAFTQETGNTYREALDAGASQDTAALTATLVGLINGAIEIGLPGGNGGIQDLPERLIKNGKGSRKAIQEWVESSVSEGKEEILQGIISNLAEKLGYNKAKAWTGNEGVFDVNALAKEGFMGMAVGGILGGGQAIGVDAYNRSVQNKINQQYAATGARFRNKADTIIENALNLPETTEAYKLAQELKSRQSEDLDEEQKSKLYSNEEIGRLYSQTMRDTGIDYNPRADALEAIENRLKHLGETSDTRETAQLVLEAAERGVLSSVDKSTKLKSSKYGQRVLNEFRDSELIPQYDSEWADKLRLRTAEKAATPELTQAERGARIERLERKVNDNVNPAEKADIDTLAEKYGAQANVFKEAAKAVEGTDIYYFDDAYHTVYQLAKSGLDESTIRKDMKTSWLSPSAFQVAYKAGQAAQTTKSGTRYNPNATLKLNGINYKSLNNKQRASVRALMEIARVTGINIELFDSTTASGALGDEQGSYSNGKIRIDINAGMLDKGDILNVAMLRTASHELTHYIQQNNKDAYKELKDFVFDKLQVTMFSDGKYKDADTWIRAKMDTLKMEDNAKNYDIASDEVIADACEMMLKDSTAFETLAKENPSLARRLLDWLKGLIADIKKAFSGVEAASTEAKAMVDSMEELQKKWDAALVGAVENTNRNEAISNISSPEVQNSLRYDAQYMDKAMQMNSIVPKNVMDAARAARGTVAERFLDPDVQESLGLPPDIIGNTYIPNGSYDGTEENTTVCVRSMAVDALMDAVAEKLGRPLTVADTIAISQEYWKYTDSPECLYCYVAMDRKAYREYLGSYLKQRDDVIENIKNGMNRNEAYEKFLDGRKDTKQMQRRFSMWVTNYNKGAATITPADLASDANMQAAVERDSSLEAQINDARKYAQGASWAKKRISYRAYNNHILKWTTNRIENLNKHYGLRMYSFSDYSPAFILENMQMITDAAVRGLKMLAYTKELDFVKIFAPTGMNINISVFGHQQNGMISQDAMQGADWEQAQNLRKKYGNVGITFVATNDEQVEWAMAQDWVDVVIPFHLVRTGAKVADYFGWKNYSGMQADVKSKAWKKGDATSIYPSEHHNDKAAYLAALEKNNLTPRFAQWVDNPNYMKLVNETRRSADETPLVQPVFDTDAALKSIETMRKRGGYYVPIGGTDEEMHDIAAEIAEGIDNTQYSRRTTSETEDTQYQLREQISTREALAGALMNITENEAERTKLEKYIDGIEKIDAAQARVAEIGREIHDIMFTKGSDRSNLKALQAEKKNLESEIDRYDKMLIGLQSTKPLKALQERALARAKTEAKATARADARALARTARELARMTSRVESFERARERRDTNAVRKSIKGMMEKWNSKLQSDTPARNIPAPFKTAIAELSQALDLTSGRPMSEKAVDKLNKLKSAYDYVMSDNDFKVYQNPIAKMYVDNAINIINNTPLRQMGREQLEALYDAMKCINSTMFEANKLRDKAYRHDLAETGTAMIEDTIEAEAPKWKFWRDYETWQLTPARFFAMLGGWKKNSAWEQVAASFQEGTRRALRVERDFYNQFRRFTEAPELDRLTNPHKLIGIGLTSKDGSPVKITRGMMLSIYMHLLSEDNRRAVLYGGFNVPVLSEYYGQKIAESYTTGHENVVGILEDMTKLSEQIYQISTDKSLTDEEKQQKIEEIGKKQDALEAEGYDRLDALKNRIYNEMTDFEKQLTEAATAWNDGNSQNYINEVTMTQYQIKRAKVKNYWAIHRDTSFVQTDFESIAKNMNLANVGWLKDRVKSAAPVLLTDFVYEMDNSVKRVATFYGYAIAQADFNKLYNYKIPGVNKSVQDEVKRKYGGGKKDFGVTADQYVENFIGDVVGSRIKPDRSVWAAVRRNLPRATLTLNPRVALSQIASVPTAAAEVGWGAMARGFFRGLPTAFKKSAKEDLMQRDEYFFQRYRGDGSMREFADMKSGNNVIDKLWNKADKLTKHALLNWCQNCDVFATATMWSMAEEWVKANTNLTGEEFDAAVKQKYDDIITKTQPNYTTTERSDLLRDTREAYKFLTMYKTQSNQNFNILKEANARLRKTASDYKNGKNGVTKADLNEARKRFANAYSAVLLGGTLAFVALRAIANAILGHMNDYRDDDDEITKASVLNGITVASLQSMANMFVLGSEVEALVEKSITGKKYYGLEDTALASANNVLKQLQALAVAYATGETKDVGTKWAKLTQNAAQIVGLPYSSVKTFIEAGKTWAKDIENGTFGSFEGGVTRSNSVNYNRLYEALENGNTVKADSIREEIRRNSPDIEDKTIESGLRGVIKDMWEEGAISSSEAVDKLVEYTGKDKDTAYWDVQKWGNKANAEEDEKYTDSNYYRLWQVIDNDGDAEAAMSELLEHGKDANQVATDIRSHIKDEFNAGTLTEREAADKLYKYGTHKDNGKQVKYTVQEANDIVSEWAAKQKLGWDYDDKENLYKNGEISKTELKQAMMNVGGYTSEKADEKILVYDWQNEGYSDITYASIKEYNAGPKSAGVSHAIWYKYWLAEKSLQADYKANGDTIPYSKMIKVFQYIGNLNITNDQKYALAKTYTDSDTNIAKYKTW